MTLLVVFTAKMAWAQSPIGSIQWNSNGFYEINSQANLQDLAAYVEGHDAAGLTFKMTADITMTAEHTAIGSLEHAFCGTFDGDNHIISNLTIDQPNEDCQGLFGAVAEGAIIKNVTLENCDITAKANVGGIVGRAESGTDATGDITIQNCHVNGTIDATVVDANYHGGIVGYAECTNITSCTMQGEITSNEQNQSYGGIVGLAYTLVNVTSCENTAEINGISKYCGGIVGDEYNGLGSNTYTDCFNAGLINGIWNVAGVCGYPKNAGNDYAHFSHCYTGYPCELMALGSSSYEFVRQGKAERAYLINTNEHITSMTVAETPSYVSTLTGYTYYAAGDWHLTFGLEAGYNFVAYDYNTGTLTNTTVAGGEHVLTIDFIMTNSVIQPNVEIAALMSSTTAVDIAGATVSIGSQRWHGNRPTIATISATYGSTPLTEGVDYVTAYTNNINKGTANVTLTGINGYMGTKAETFEIVDFVMPDSESPNSETNPYLISSEADLKALADIVVSKARNGGYYKQMHDITLQKEHVAIGWNNNSYDADLYAFKGTYDGNNKSIYNLHINKKYTSERDDAHQGFFGYIYGATIKDLNIVDCDITAYKGSGCLAGGASSNSTIQNCTVSGSIKALRGAQYIGGIVGSINSSALIDCINNATVIGTAESNYVGGISGSHANGGSLINNVNNGAVYGNKYVGGITGQEYKGTFSYNFNTGAVNGSGMYTGSLIGMKGSDSDVTLSNNYYLASSGEFGGVGAYPAFTDVDMAGAEIIVKVSAGDGVNMTLPATPTYVYNAENYYKSGTQVTLDYAVPAGKVFDHYSVNTGVISNAGVQTGAHALTGFKDDVVINGSYADSMIDISTATVAAIPNLTYNGQTQHPKPVVTIGNDTLVENDNYTLSYTGGLSVSTYNIIIKGTGRYTGQKTKNFTIVPFDITPDNAISIDGVLTEYGMNADNSVIHPEPTITCASTNNATLVSNTNYQLSYSDGCAYPGNYEITITGVGNYTGSQTVPFTIVDAYALTVHDNTVTNNKVPFYGDDMSSYQKVEYIMTASELSEMNGKAITGMRIYASGYNKQYPDFGTMRFRIFMKPYNYNVLNGFQGTTNATIVYEGAIEKAGVITIKFTTPYIYTGGNLLIGFYVTEKSNHYNAFNFYGENVLSGSSYRGQNTVSLVSITSGEKLTFVPKTTFWYSSYDEVPTISGYTSNTDGWKFIASPLTYDVDPTHVSHLIDATEANYDLFRFNQSGANGEWENYKTHTADFMLENGQGYLYARNANVDITFAGILNTAASKTVNLDYDGTAQYAGWNLVGNPFNASATIDKPYYRMNSTGTNIEAVAAYSTTPIAACNGVMVQATAAGQNVTFTKGAKSMDESADLQMTLVKADMRGNEMQDNAIVSFSTDAQLGKYIFNQNTAKLYIPQDGEDYAIAYSDRQGEMPLCFDAKESSKYTISFEGATEGISIIDKVEGKTIDLSADNSYTFMGSPADRNDRFSIVFNASDDIFAYQNGNDIIVNGNGELQVFDVMGRMVMNQNINGVEKINVSANGVYIFRMNDKTQKIVVR